MQIWTFGQKVLEFYRHLEPPKVEEFGVDIINPHAHTSTQPYTSTFYKAFYNDISKRVFIFGINPGRFGSGVTGIPFTDPVALLTHCGISNDLEKRKELSSEFVYESINAFGGPQNFFGHFYLTAVSPIGFTKNGINYNYYDDREFYEAVRPFLIKSIQDQLQLGALRDNVIVFGMGKNLRIFEDLNREHGFFAKIHPLEHPRYVMQYKRKEMSRYIKKYVDTFSSALQ
jgi:hypothetical protein